MSEEVRTLQEKLQQYELFVKEGTLLQTMQEMRSQVRLHFFPVIALGFLKSSLARRQNP